MPAKPEIEVVLTSADIRNGWTVETMRHYLKEREEQKIRYATEQSKFPRVQVETTSGYNPHKF